MNSALKTFFEYLAIIFAASLICVALLCAGIFGEREAFAEETADNVKVVFDYCRTEGEPEETYLPMGSRVVFPAETPARNGYNFAGWFDDNDREYDDLPIYSDRRFHAKWTLNDLWMGYFSDYSRNVVYGETVTLEITDLSSEVEYRYVWMKKAADGTWNEIAGADGASFNLKNVADSGVFRVKVNYKDPVSGAERQTVSPEATVVIAPVELSVRAVGAERMIYDGRAKTVGAELVGILAGDSVSFSVDGNTATDVGVYRARVSDLGNRNYRIAEDAGFDYEIKRGEMKFARREGLPEMSLKAERGFSYGVAAEYSTLIRVPEGVDVGNATVFGKYGFSLDGFDSERDGAVTVRLKLKDELGENSAPKVLFKASDGTVYAPEFDFSDGYLTFSAESDGEIVITFEKSTAWWRWLLSVAAIVIPVAAAVIAYLIKKKRNPAENTAPVSFAENSEPLEPTSETVFDGYGEEDEGDETLDGSEIGAPTVDTDISFNKKLAAADNQIKVWYSVIKNDLLSYRGVKSRVSSTCDSFRVSRKLVAKITLIGSTLRVSLALDPENERFNDGRFPHKNKGDKHMYKDVPFQVKIKTDLGLRRARALITEMMKDRKIKKDSSYEKIDYAALYETPKV